MYTTDNAKLSIKTLIQPIHRYEDYTLKRPAAPYPSPTEKRLRTSSTGNQYETIRNYLPSPENPYAMTQHLCRVPIVPISKAEDEQPRKKAIAQPRRKVIPSPIQRPSHVVSDDGRRIWKMDQSIGKGGCGEVFIAKELYRPSELVAVKVIQDRKQYLAELNTMKLLHSHPNGRGYTPKLISACKKRKTLVMEYLSETLASKFDQTKFRFSLKTILMIALNTVIAINKLSLIKDFNDKTGCVHVDIKPSNICVHRQNLYLIDFGYSTSPEVKLPGQTGTPLFMSYTLQTIGVTYPTIQDDFESLGYVLMFLIGGGKKGLPWGTLKTHKEIAASKSDEAIQDFCSDLVGGEYEPIAQSLLTYMYIVRTRTRSFGWIEYEMLYREFEDVLLHCGMGNDRCYDWCDEHSRQMIISTSATLIQPEPHYYLN